MKNTTISYSFVPLSCVLRNSTSLYVSEPYEIGLQFYLFDPFKGTLLHTTISELQNLNYDSIVYRYNHGHINITSNNYKFFVYNRSLVGVPELIITDYGYFTFYSYIPRKSKNEKK